MYSKKKKTELKKLDETALKPLINHLIDIIIDIFLLFIQVLNLFELISFLNFYIFFK